MTDTHQAGGLLGRWLSHYLSCTLTSMGVPGSEATKAKQFAWDGEECIIGTENYTFTWFPWQSISLNSSFDPYSNIRREVGRENSCEKTGPHAHHSVLLTPVALPADLTTPVALRFSYRVSAYSLWTPSGQARKHQTMSANHLSAQQTLDSVCQTSHPCGKCLREAAEERRALSFQLIVSEASIHHVGEAVVD